MDKNNLIGFVLMFLLMLGYLYITAPSPEEMAEHQRLQDSIALAEQIAENPETAIASENSATTNTKHPVTLPDSILQSQMAGKLGVFAAAGTGTASSQVLENEMMKITFSTKGGRITSVELKDYDKVTTNEDDTKNRTLVKLLEDEKNKFEYLIPLGNVSAGAVSTEDLYFSPQISGNTITFRANASNGGFFEQKYTLSDNYLIDYAVRMEGMDGMLDRSAESLQLNWVNFMDRIEENHWFEKTYSGIYYKTLEEDPDYCDCRSDDEEELEEPVKWVSNANQFFNASLVANDKFSSADLKIIMLDDDNTDMKKITAKMTLPLAQANSTGVGMQLFVGPNDFDRLRNLSDGLEQIIPYGWSIFGTINRYAIRPFFQFLLNIVGSKGLSILLMTFIIKFALFPLTYKMLYSQQKMAALKPRLAKLKDKFGDDPQKQQMETMKMYREYGVSPLGGCLPMIVQMPIWYALFRFFPSSIDFRQASFLWADDLSSYDAFFKLPFELPFGMGSHLSLFAILWALSMLAYTYYNSKHMDMSANPAMKYMQYLMPVMFFGFFNAYASGLTCYMFFSNFLNIVQNLGTKNFIIDHDKINQELEDYKKKPKKAGGGFQERLQKALDEQQKIQAQKEAQKAKKGKKKK